MFYLEPELELFEVDDISHDGDDELSFHYLPNLAVLGPKVLTFFRREQKFLYPHNRKPPRHHDIKWPKMTKNVNFGPNLADFL